jgi:SulP family sulfate permease
MRTQAAKDLLIRYLPIMSWLPQYQRSWLRADFIAGLTVWAVMVPTALAYTGIAGVDPVIGLYTVPLALVGYALFGTSRSLVVGPDSATALLSAHTIGTLVAQNSSDYLALTTSLAFLTGAIFLLFGFLRLGWVANFISQPVMKGFIQGLALVTMMTQLPKMFGVANVQGDFFQRVWALSLELPGTHILTLAVAVAGLALLFGLPHISPKVPAALAQSPRVCLPSVSPTLLRHISRPSSTAHWPSFCSTTPSRSVPPKRRLWLPAERLTPTRN